MNNIDQHWIMNVYDMKALLLQIWPLLKFGLDQGNTENMRAKDKDYVF